MQNPGQSARGLVILVCAAQMLVQIGAYTWPALLPQFVDAWVLIEAKRAGVHSFCITIDRDAASYLPRMYGAVNYTVIEDVARLPVKVAEVYRRLTT